MIARGHVQGGVVVLADGVRLAEGQEVTVFALPAATASDARLSPAPAQPDAARLVSPERREALLRLIGIWKTDQPPSDEEVERMVERQRMKHG